MSHSRAITRPRRFGLVAGLASLGFGPGEGVAAVASDEIVERYNPQLARTRLSPCSTFKIPNSLVGLETGVIPDASFVIPWDGHEREIEAWNVQDAPGDGIVYRGKTGTSDGATPAESHGWWVGSVERGERLYVFAALIQGDGAAGRVCHGGESVARAGSAAGGRASSGAGTLMRPHPRSH